MQQMGSEDNTTITVCKPFSIREYVFVARQKDIRPNWPFLEEYLQVCVKHGITRVLPPFESRDSVRSLLNKDVGSNEKSCVELCGEGEVVKAGSEHGDNSGLNHDIVLHHMASEVHISTTKPSFNFHGDLPSLCLSAVPSKKWSTCKRKKRKGKLKKRSMADICANARPCTLEELDKINGSNWAVELGVVPYIGNRSAIKSEHLLELNGSHTSDFDCRHKSEESNRAELSVIPYNGDQKTIKRENLLEVNGSVAAEFNHKHKLEEGSNGAADPSVIPYIADLIAMKNENLFEVNGSVAADFNCRHKSEGFWKTKHPRGNSSDISNVVGKKRRIMEINLNRCKFKSQNKNVLTFSSDEAKERCGATTEYEFETASQGLGRENPEFTGCSWPKDSIITRKEIGHSDRVDLTCTKKCLKGLGSNSLKHLPVISDRNGTQIWKTKRN